MKKPTKNYSILDVSEMTKEEWKLKQPFYKNLAKNGYFTNHLPYTDFHDSFYIAIGHPKHTDVDNDYHLVSYPLYKKEITPALHFIHTEYDQTLKILMVNVTYTGLWAVLWQIILHLCVKYEIKKISLFDRAFYGDPWSHYGFSGVLHDKERVLYLKDA